MSVYRSFPGHAHQGIKKLFTANILALAVTALLILTLVVALTGGYSAIKSLNALSVIVLILSLVTLVLEIVGVCQAIHDERYFANARNLLILTIVLAFINFFAESVLLDLAGDVTSLLASLYIIKGIMRLARTLNNWSVHHLGQRLYRLELIVGCGFLGLSVLSSVIQSRGSGVDRILVFILALSGLVLSIVATVMYTMYLYKAVKMTDIIYPGQPQGAEPYNDAYLNL